MISDLKHNKKEQDLPIRKRTERHLIERLNVEKNLRKVFHLASEVHHILNSESLRASLAICGKLATLKLILNPSSEQRGYRLVIALSCLLFFLIPLKVWAQEQEIERSYTLVNPSIFHDLTPGEKTEGVSKIINQSNVPLTFQITIQDYIVYDTKGTPVMLSPNSLSQKYSAASWISASPNVFTLGPGQKQTVNYKIEVPAEARPGGHYAAIIYSPVSATSEIATGGRINTQIGSLFYLSIKGNIKEEAQLLKFEASRFYEYGPVTILTRIKNLGDLHIAPKGSIKVTGLFFEQKQDLPNHNIFPETARDFENNFGSMFMLGQYKAQLIASYGQNNNLPLTATFYFWVFPWRLAVVIFLMIIATVLGIILLEEKKKDAHKTPEEPKTETQNPSPTL